MFVISLTDTLSIEPVKLLVFDLKYKGDAVIALKNTVTVCVVVVKP